ncbi:DUF2218 domain-containing protein [Aureimonas sp. SA4125]|uniref:DUF2218 domain-containing protein n=1 Tax=Aureimonas sp. SA4125 TaxID=2826993 RepID=UPI0031F668E9
MSPSRRTKVPCASQKPLGSCGQSRRPWWSASRQTIRPVLERMKGVVATHLDRFAFREAPLGFEWS